jgi:acetoin utilization deacetylase AcuC-like enzyme
VHNFPLPAGTGDPQFLATYRDSIGPALNEFQPELIMVSAGFDAHRDDPLASLEVTTEAYAELAALIQGWALRHCQGRSVWVLEGGYDLEAIGASTVACLRALAENR